MCIISERNKLNSIDYLMSEKARKEIIELYNKYGSTDELIDINYFKIPTILFRYSSINEYVIKDLENHSLSATSPTEFNDLYDSTMHFDNVSDYRRRFKELNDGSKKLGMGEVISKEMEVVLEKQAIELDEHSLTYLTKDFKIICLSSNSDDIKMWSHYSNKNKGICVAYDFNKCTTNLKKFIYPIVYINKPIDVTELCEVNNQVMLAALISVISKFKDWEHEREWRIIFYLLNDPEKRIDIINIPRPEFIILGSKFIENIEVSRFANRSEYLLIQKFIKYVEEAEIELKIVKPQIRSFQLEFAEINVKDILREFR